MRNIWYSQQVNTRILLAGTLAALLLAGQPLTVAAKTPPAPPPTPVCTISGGPGDDTLTGTAGNDVICGLGGNDTLVGLGGNDTLIGGEGNDVLLGGAGNDTLTGGNGTDTASFATETVAITASPSQATGAGTDTITTTENLIGGSGNDKLTGDAGANTLVGNGGNDTLTGGDGNDTIEGDAGNDTIKADAGNDVVTGGLGNDTLAGGAGDDKLAGGSGTDAVSGDAGTDICAVNDVPDQNGNTLCERWGFRLSQPLANFIQSFRVTTPAEQHSKGNTWPAEGLLFAEPLLCFSQNCGDRMSHYAVVKRDTRLTIGGVLTNGWSGGWFGTTGWFGWNGGVWYSDSRGEQGGSDPGIQYVEVDSLAFSNGYYLLDPLPGDQ